MMFLMLLIVGLGVTLCPVVSKFITSRGIEFGLDSLYHYVSIDVPIGSNGYRKRFGDRVIYTQKMYLSLTSTLGPMTLSLTRNDNLISPEYEYIEGTNAKAADSLRKSPPDNCFYQGYVNKYPSSLVAVSLCDGVHGMIELSPNVRYTIHALNPDQAPSNYSKTPARALSGRSHVLVREHINKSLENTGNPSPSARTSSCFIVEPPISNKPNLAHGNLSDPLSNDPNFGGHASSLYRPPNSRQTAELLFMNDYQRYTQWGPELVEISTIEIANTVSAMYRQSSVLPSGYTLSISIAGVYTATEPMWYPRNTTSVQAEDLLFETCDWRWNQKSTYPNTAFGRADAVHVLSGRVFATAEDPNPSPTNPSLLGLAYIGTMCSSYSCGINYSSRTAGIGNMAATVAHELGHNFGSSHDSTGNTCPEEGFIMAAYGCYNCPNYPTVFSSCSKDQISSWFSDGGLTTFGGPHCLNNVPTLCGNGVVDGGEACDSGNTIAGSTCCTPTCQLRANAQCDRSNGQCCDISTCKYRSMGTECRAQVPDRPCDVSDVCSGTSAKCPDVIRANGTLCSTAIHGPGTCLNGSCSNRAMQCAQYGFGWMAECDANGPPCELKCRNGMGCISVSSSLSSPRFNVSDFGWCRTLSSNVGSCLAGQCTVRVPRIVLGTGASGSYSNSGNGPSTTTMSGTLGPTAPGTSTPTTLGTHNPTAPETSNPTTSSTDSSTTPGTNNPTTPTMDSPITTTTNSTSSASPLKIPYPFRTDHTIVFEMQKTFPLFIMIMGVMVSTM